MGKTTIVVNQGKEFMIKTRYTWAKKTRTLKKSVGQADSHLLQPTQSSVLGAEAIYLALHPSQGIISNTSVGQARTH